MENEELFKRFKGLTQDQLNERFIDCCKYGDLDGVKYLLTSQDLKEHANVHARASHGFQSSCFNSHFNIIQFLIFDFGIDKNKIIDIFLTTCPNEQ